MATTFGRILLRRDTATNWAASNPVLANGEPGWDSTNKSLKVGDGTSTWSTLTGITGGGGGVSLPAGGTTGQALVKNSNTSGDAVWSTNVLTASSAAKLTTARTIAGKSFDGTGNITIATTDLSDFAPTAPTDGLTPAFDIDSGKYVPKDLSETFTLQDSAGRLAQTAWQKYFTPTVIVDESTAAPSDFPVGGIVFERPAPVSLVPLLMGTNFLNASTSVTTTCTTTSAAAIGDWIGIAVMLDGSVSTPPGAVLPTTMTVTTGAGAFTVTAGPTTFSSGTVQVNLFYAKVTTLIPSGSTITVTTNQIRTHRSITLFKMPNLVATTPLDQSATNSGNSSATLSLAVGPTAATVVANELGILFIGHNDSTTATRPLVGTNGWTVLAAIESDNATTSRTSTVLYRVESTTGTKTGTVNVNASDGSTGAWAGVVGFFKGA